MYKLHMYNVCNWIMTNRLIGTEDKATGPATTTEVWGKPQRFQIMQLGSEIQDFLPALQVTILTSSLLQRHCLINCHATLTGGYGLLSLSILYSSPSLYYTLKLSSLLFLYAFFVERSLRGAYLTVRGNKNRLKFLWPLLNISRFEIIWKNIQT